MDWMTIGIGVLVIVLGIVDSFDGASDFFFGPKWMNDYIRKNEHPILFALCLGIYFVVGVALVAIGIKG